MPTTYAIAYVFLAIALLTLNPFQFQAYDPSEGWVWRFWLRDVGQNILLFMPLGILLRQSLGLPYGLCLTSGFLLSLSIESAQLFIADRTSSYIDLAANAMGALLGALLGAFLHRLGLEPSNRFSRQLTLAMMFIPLCWVRAIVVEWQSSAAWLLLPTLIAVLALLKSAHPRYLNQTQFIWFLIALIPLATHSTITCALVVGASILVSQLAHQWGLSNKHLCIGALSTTVGLLLTRNGLWLWHQAASAGEAWYNLRWIEVLLAGLLLVSSLTPQCFAIIHSRDDL